MTWVVDETVSEIFSTGVAGETFTRAPGNASYIDNAVVVWDPTFTDLGSGFYRWTYVPSVSGAHEWAGSGSTSGALAINFDVVTAAQADPAAALAGATLTVVSPLDTATGDLTIRQGDDYLTADGDALTFALGASPDLSGLTVTWTLTWGATEVLSKTASVSGAGTSTQTVTVELTAVNTAALSRGIVYRYALRTNGNDTLGAGRVVVVRGA